MLAAFWWALIGIVSSFAAITYLNLRWHNAKAERMYRAFPQVEGAVDILVRHVTQLKNQQVALADFSVAVALAGQQASENELKSKVSDLLSSIVGLLEGDGQPRVRILLKQGEELIPYAWYVPRDMPEFNNRPFALDYGAVGRAYQTGQAVLIPNIAQDELFADKHSSASAYQCVLCVPIPTAGDVVGVLNLDSPYVGYFTEEHLSVLRICSNFLFHLFIPKDLPKH